MVITTQRDVYSKRQFFTFSKMVQIYRTWIDTLVVEIIFCKYKRSFESINVHGRDIKFGW